eukprot:PhM_4_TR4484/c1_g1_i1/m.73466/K14537/NUG2, GNL2; nuclear GTP-binding protein
MGKPGKKAGDLVGPATNVNRRDTGNRTDLRSQRKIKVLKMYNTRIKRDPRSGKIVSGSVLSASDRVERTVARIAPDRRWFGNTRVIGANALQTFRDEMKAKQNDPYSVVLKQGKLPMSLLEDAKNNTGVTNEMKFADTFGKKSVRKRPKLVYTELEGMKEVAATRTEEYGAGAKDMQLARNQVEDNADKGTKRKLFEKGQSARIWNELYKVIDSSDVIMYIIDARDPMGTRSRFIEDYIRKEKRYKHFVFVLNKCDLVPSWAVARWLQILSKDHPTIAMHSSTTNPFGKGNLINLLRQFSRLHNVTNKASTKNAREGRNPISVGVIGYPNVGKSSVINTLRRKKVCKVAPIPGETKVWQYVMLTRSIFLVDCPGVVCDREANNDVQAVLKGVVRVERMGDIGKEDVIETMLQIVKPKDLTAKYGVKSWTDAEDFLEQVARERGKLLPGGVPDTDSIARTMLYDWQRGGVPWFNAPPFESNQKYRDAVHLPEAQHMKFIQNYSSFNIVDDQIIQSMREDEEGDVEGKPAAEEDEIVDEEVEEVEEDVEEEEDNNKQEEAKAVEKPVAATTPKAPAPKQKAGKPIVELPAKKAGGPTKRAAQRQEEAVAPVAGSGMDDDALWAAVMSSGSNDDLRKVKVVKKK